MFALTALLQALLFRFIIGEEDYCSSNIGKKPDCVPCSNLCPDEKTSCNTTYSFCPKQCGNSINSRECTRVCDDNCLNGRCEYTEGTLNLRCIGCKPEFTGLMCKEFCDPNCLECDQYTSTCKKCRKKYRLPDCSEMFEETSAMPDAFSTVEVSSFSTAEVSSFSTAEVSSFSAAEVSLYNCSLNCSSCDFTSGFCIECPHGNYGERCENGCTHCDDSLCAKDINCTECISKLSSNECATAVNCSEQECHLKQETKAAPVYRWRKEDILTLICGILAAVVLAFTVICSWKYRQRSVDKY